MIFAELGERCGWEDIDQRLRKDGRPGTRLLLNEPDAAGLARLGTTARVASEFLSKPAKPVRGILFNKSPDANWAVPWHIDRVGAFAEPHEVEGFGPWVQKEGVWHAKCPDGLLEQMCVVRLHLDAAKAENGALKVRNEHGEQLVTAHRGEITVMGALTEHASDRATSDAPRRVVHIEYAATDPPAPLRWHWG